jgi:branched-chain amino acid transport system ATP-binding protein
MLSDLPYSVRKVADLARALALEPRILLLDEPSAGMGALEREQLQALLHRVVEQSVETLVIVDHDIDFIRDLCDRLVVLDAGRLIAAGPSDEVLRERAVIEAYLGA